MKKWIARGMTMLLLLSSLAAGALAAAEPQSVTDASASQPMPTNLKLGGRDALEVYEELIVGSTTALSGNFFSAMWGNNTADIDVRDLIHGYNLVEWVGSQGMFTVDQSVVSGIAATLNTTTGDKTYVISLADDLVYSDGSPITARDYLFSILLSTSPEVQAIGGQTTGVRYIVGADAYASGQSKQFSGVRLISDRQFTLTISGRFLPFFYEMGLLSFHPFPISAIAPGCEVADDGQGAYIRNIGGAGEPVFTAALLDKTILGENGYLSHPSVTSGPYRLDSYDEAAQVARFSINPHFKGTSAGVKPTIQRLIYRQVAPGDMMRQLEDGEVDLLNKATQGAVVSAGFAAVANNRARSGYYLRSGMSLISFNCEQGPAQFQAVRQAIALCFDRQAFLESYIANNGMLVNGYYGIGQWMTQLVNGTIAPPSADGVEADQAVWDALKGELSALNPYALDPAAAEALLVRDGWTLDASGAAYDGAGGVRCKMVDGVLMKLELTLLVPEGNDAADALHALLADNLKGIGAELTIEKMPIAEMFARYYRQVPRDNDMFYLGTNFVSVFDPTYVYAVEDQYQGVNNTTGLRDAELYRLASELSKTPEGDVMAYCQKWLAFQRHWNQVLPAVPVYSNVYYDFYTPRLQNYQIANHSSWAKAVVAAYLSDAQPQQELTASDDLMVIG